MTAQKHTLYRSTQNRMIGGVAGGMAEYFGVDATLMRLVFILLVMLPGIGIIAYIIAWVIIPENPHQTKPVQQTESHTEAKVGHDTKVEPDKTNEHRAATASSRRALGLALVALGIFFLLRHVINFHYLKQLWPLALVLVGLFIIFGRGKRA